MLLWAQSQLGEKCRCCRLVASTIGARLHRILRAPQYCRTNSAALVALRSVGTVADTSCERWGCCRFPHVVDVATGQLESAEFED